MKIFRLFCMRIRILLLFENEEMETLAHLHNYTDINSFFVILSRFLSNMNSNLKNFIIAISKYLFCL